MRKTATYDLILLHPAYNRRKYSGTVYPLGLGYIASAAMREGYSVKIIDCAAYFETLDYQSLERLERWLEDQFKTIKARLAIGIGPCTTSAVRSIKVISETCKKIFKGQPLIFGGPLASISGQTGLFFSEFSADLVVRGDGESAISEILNALKFNKQLEGIRGVATKINQNAELNVETDLNNLSFPLRPDSKMRKLYSPSTRRNNFLEPFATMLISRGCPYTCSYCVSGNLRNGDYHRRSWDNVVKEIEEIQKTNKVRSLIFYDDTFFPSANTLESDIIGLWKKFKGSINDIKWQIEMRPNVFMSLEISLIKYLFESGCNQINLGIETSASGASRTLNKSINPEELKSKCIQILSTEPGMKLTGTFILGGPEETKQSIAETIEYSTTLGLLYAHYYPLELYPGTQLFNNFKKINDVYWWYKEIMNDDLEWGEIIYESDDLDRATLLESVSYAYQYFYDRPSWIKIAKAHLGQNFAKVQEQVPEWVENRFQITMGA